MWYKDGMNEGSRARALARLLVFTVGSWVVVASGLFAVLSRYPARWRRSGGMVNRWGRLGCRCLGIEVELSGALPPLGSLVVANHLGYADIFTVGSLFEAVFAARHDMRTWPMLGALSRSGATIFINRDVKRAGARGIAQVAAALGAGATVIAFPEGTSTDGTGLLPFRTGIFQAAVESGAPVVPAALRYVALDGAPITNCSREVVTWVGGPPIVPHLIRLASHRVVSARVELGPAIRPPHRDRRTLAARAEASLRRTLGFAPDQLPAAAGRRAGLPAPGGRQG